MRMNSAPGKEILSLVREGNYAHPGEEIAIDLVFSGLTTDHSRQILDIGCGRGGTAEYVRKSGFGKVTGVDIDAETLAAARELYPQVNFVVADATRISELWQSRFDLVYLFNAFYAFPDQQRSLREMHRVARDGARLMIFDYTGRGGSPHDSVGDATSPEKPFNNQGWTPLHPERFPDQMRQAGWELERTVDFTAEYRQWYQQLCNRITEKMEVIVSCYGAEWYDYVLGTYRKLLASVEDGSIGGATYWARRI